MTNAAGWCGSGGPWITPELSMQKVVGPRRRRKARNISIRRWRNRRRRQDTIRTSAVVAFPAPGGDAKIADIQGKAAFVRQDFPPATAKYAEPPAEQIIQTNRIVDLTARFKDGRLDWDVPAGKWTIVRFGHTSTGVVNHPRLKGAWAWNPTSSARKPPVPRSGDLWAS